MTIEEIKSRKTALGLTNEMIADASGIPLSTIQKIMSGTTKAPRKLTLEAIESVLYTEEQRRKRQGVEGVFMSVLGIFNDDLNYKMVPEDMIYRIKNQMDRFLTQLDARLPGLQVFLISPPKLFLLADLLDVLDKLQPLYLNIAEKHRAFFASAYAWNIPLSADDVHFSAEGHRLFAHC